MNKSSFRERIGADVMKKIMIYTVMMHRQMAKERFFGLLESAPWFEDTVQRFFDKDTRQVYRRFLSELVQRGLLKETEGVLTTTVPP